MQIEPATRADIPALLTLIHSAYRGDSSRRGWTHEADLLDGQRTDAAALTETLDDPAQLLLVARDGDRLAGCIALTDKRGLGYIGLVTVDPERQSGGLGRQLLDAAEDAARTRFAATRCEMTVIDGRDELVAWYRRRGYRLTGERRPFPATDPRFGMPRKPLEFVVLEKPL